MEDSDVANPCDYCKKETGSDAMMFCSRQCQTDWRMAELLKATNARKDEAA